MTKKYVNAYLNTIDVPSYNTKKLFAVGLIGLVGSGKSTFAKKLAERLGLYVATNDRIRRWLNEKGIEGASPDQMSLQEIAEATTRYLYSNHVSHIIDADLIKFHGVAAHYARNAGAEFFLVVVTAPEEVIIERLRLRSLGQTDAHDLSQVGLEEYEKRKELHAALPRPHNVLFTVDTSQNVDKQIDQIIIKLRAAKVVA